MLLSAGKYMQAEQMFQDVIDEDARCAVAYAGQGASQLFIGDVQSAEDSFQRAISVDPQCPSALVGRGAVGYVAGDYQSAMEAYRHALAYDVRYKSDIRASVAHIACLMGFYRSAISDAKSALAQDPDCELAEQVLAAAYIAHGRPGDALDALRSPGTDGASVGPALTAQSPLFSPRAAYFEDHQMDPAVRLASLEPLGLGAFEGPGEPEVVETEPQEDEDLSITWPKQGASVRGSIDVAIEPAPDLNVDYVAVLLDDRFVGVSNARPFRIHVNTRLCPDGVKQLRCEAYNRAGQVVATCHQLISVANGDRTLSAREQMRRGELDAVLQAHLVLHADPLHRAQLCGHALRELGRLDEAVSALEYAFSYNPAMSGIRADLLLGYFELGILGGNGVEIHRISRGEKAVALTFDDGPHPVLTPVILDLLDQYNAKGTFTLVGKQAEMYPGLVREIANRGHELGNHSYSHRDLTTLSRLEVERELVMTRQVIRRACGEFVTLFRPPGGHYNSTVRAAARATGFTTVFWNENIGNYPGRGPQEIAYSMVRKIGRNGIILLHNGYDETPNMLPHLLALLDERGYRMDTVSALTSHRPFEADRRVAGAVEWSAQ